VSDVGTTIGIAVGVTAAVLIIIAVIIIVLCLLYKKRFDCFVKIIFVNCAFAFC